MTIKILVKENQIKTYENLVSLFPVDPSLTGYWKDLYNSLNDVTGLPYPDTSTKKIRLLFSDGQSRKGTVYKYINLNVEVRLGLPFSVLSIRGKEGMNAFTEAIKPDVSNWEDTMKEWGFPTEFKWDKVTCTVTLRKEQSLYSAVNTHFPQWVNDIWKREYPEIYDDVCSLEFALKSHQWEIAASSLWRLDSFKNPKADRHFNCQKRYQRPA